MGNLKIKPFRFLFFTFISMTGLCAWAQAYESEGGPKTDISKEDVYRVVDEDGGTSTGALSRILYRVLDPKDKNHFANRGPARIQICIKIKGRAKIQSTTFDSNPVKSTATPPDSKAGKLTATILAEGPFQILESTVTSSLLDSSRPNAAVEILRTTPTLIGVTTQPSGGRVMLIATVSTEQLVKIVTTKVSVKRGEILLDIRTAHFPQFVSASLSVGQIGSDKPLERVASGDEKKTPAEETKLREPVVIINTKGNPEAVKTIQKTIESILGVIVNSDREDASAQKAIRKEIHKILLAAIDVNNVAALTLGAYRKPKFSDAEFKAFVAVFSNLLFSTYISHLEKYTEEKVHIIEVKEKKTRAGSMPKVMVLTKIISEDRETPMNYSMFQRDGKWLIYDLQIEGVSLVQNYRSQFREILRKDSAQDLIERMEKKVLKNDKE